MPSSFIARLVDGPPVVADGGMGALIASAFRRLRCPEEANLRAPDAVVALHVEFANAGAELLETNTFGVVRHRLGGLLSEDEAERITSIGVKLARDAREVAGRDVYVAGAIGPAGRPTAASRRRALVAEQAVLLEGRGADLLVLETFTGLDELADAVAAVRGVSSLPVVALMSFEEDGRTRDGVAARDAAERLAGLDLAAFGPNHGAGLLAALRALEQMTGHEHPLAAMPNLGLASLTGSRIVFPHASPRYFAEFAAHATALGARIVGGCCGSTPAEIAAIRSAVTGTQSRRARLTLADRGLAASLGADEEETGLERALRRREWVVSAQLDPPLGANLGGLVEIASELRASGKVGFVDLNDNAGARAGMNPIIAAAAIERSCGIETIPHLTTRDMTVMGLESVLFGAHAAGVRNVLALTGDPPGIGDHPDSRGVFELDSVGLTSLISGLNRGEDANGRPIDAPTSFFVGVAVNPSADDLDAEVERFRRKVEVGARFAMTQLLFDLEFLDRFLDRLGGGSPVPLLLGVCPLWSHRLAVRFHEELPGIVVPESLREALLAAGPSAADVGLEHARGLLDAARDRVAGVYLVVPYRQPLRVLELLS
jgi:homocysteine S-methyltransferase